jgi:hypothetical protein
VIRYSDDPAENARICAAHDRLFDPPATTDDDKPYSRNRRDLLRSFLKLISKNEEKGN